MASRMDAYVWEPREGVFCFLARFPGGGCEGGHERGPGAQMRVQQELSAIARRDGYALTRLHFYAPSEVAHA